MDRYLKIPYTGQSGVRLRVFLEFNVLRVIQVIQETRTGVPSCSWNQMKNGLLCYHSELMRILLTPYVYS